MSHHTPSHWSTHAGPNAWYTVSYPPTWTLEETQGNLGLTVPDGGGTLTISAFWIDEPQTKAVEKILDLETLFPHRRRVRQLKSSGQGDCCLGYQGEALIGKETRWWWRLFRRQRWRHWKIWCLRRGSVYILVLYLQSGRVDQEAETLASMIVDSLRFSPIPAYPPDVFARRVLELAREKFPLLDCEPVADFQLRLGESKVNLFNFYRSYVRSPDQFEAIVLPALTTVVQVQEWGQSQAEPELAAIRDRIMPMLYPEEVWQEKFPNVVGQLWVGGLAILYVVDESHAYWYIRDDLFESWSLSLEELHELALDNLNRYFEKQPMEFTVAGDEDGPRLLIPAHPDAYNSARLLSEKFQSKLRDVLGGDFAVGTPGRDFFVAVSMNSPETVENIRRKVEDDYLNMDHPLSRRLLLVTHDGVTGYAPWV